jgi:hypothetical protein
MKVIARWESARGAHYVELVETQSGFSYCANDCGGYLPATDHETAIAQLGEMVATGYFLPDAAKRPMKRVF